MTCNCLKEANDELARMDTNTRLQVGFRFTSNADAFVCLAVEKIDSKRRGRTQMVAPSYCPFCGVKYRTGREEPEAAVGAQP